MKTSSTVVFRVITLLFFLFTTTVAFSQQSEMSREEAISILQKAPGGGNLIFAGGDSRWQGRATEMVNGSETAFISTVEVAGTKVYVGGEFTSINSIDMNNVGVYDLTNGTWSPLTAVMHSESFNGVPGRVNTIEAINDDVFIGGSFSFNHPIEGNLNYIVRYNTTTPEFFGLKVGDDSQYGVQGGYPYTIVATESVAKSSSEISNGGPYYTLYVGGTFTSAGGEDAPYFAKFTYNVDGWEPLHESVELDDAVYDILVYENDVYFGGDFNSAGSVSNTRNIAAFNVFTSTLSTVGGGITESGTVYAIEKIGDNLYVGGSNITQAGGSVSFNNLARFNLNTSTWSGLATNFTGGIYAMTTLGDKLYVGGLFGQVTNDIQSRGFAYLNTTNDTWVGAGTGVSNTSTAYINGMAAFSGEVNSVQQDFVFVGGGFNAAGGNSAANVASWNAESYVPGVVDLQSPANEAFGQPLTPTLEWEKDYRANTYDLQISTTSDFQDGTIVYSKTGIEDVIDFKSAELSDVVGVEHEVEEELDYYKLYYWRVRGVGDDGTGEWSSEFQFRVQAGSPEKTAPVDGANSVSVTPTFRFVTNEFIAQNFKLKVSTNQDLSTPVIEENVGYPGKTVAEVSDAQESTFTPQTPLSHNTRYYWNAIGLEANGDEGVANDTISFLTKLAQVTTNLPSNDQNNQVVLPTFQWNSVAGANQYRIQISTSSEFTEGSTTEIVYGDLPQKNAELNNGFFEYTLEEEYELDYDTQYYWRVRGETVNNDPKVVGILSSHPDNTGDYSESKTFRTKWPVPAQVTLTSPADGATGIAVRPTFTWDSIEYTNWYYLEIYDNAGLTGDPVYTKDEIFDPNNTGKSVGGEINEPGITTVTYTIPAESDPLDNATQYFWHVRARNNTGNGDFSTSRNFRTVWREPGTISLVSPIGGVGNISLTPTLTWQEASNRTAFDLEVSTSNDFTDRDAIVYTASDLESEKKGTGISDNPEYTHDIPESTLDYVTTYYWRVRAKNPDFDGAWSNPESFETLFPVPGNVTLVSPEANATAIPVLPTFTWNQVQYTWNYDLQVWNNNTEFGDPTYENTNIPGNELKSVGSEVEDLGTREHTITTTLDNNSNYYWRVRARNNTGIGDWTDLRPFTTIWAAPATVTMVSPEDGATRQAIRPTLSWQYASNAVYYDVQIATTSDFGQDDIVYERTDLGGFAKSADEVNNGNFEHEVEENLDYSTTYYWRVKAKNPDLESDWNTAWSFETTFAPPIAPVLSAPDDAATAVSITPTLRWEYASITSHYTVQVSTDIGFNNLLVNTEVNAFGYGKTVAENTDSDIESFNIEEPLSNNTTYYWRVQGRNSTGSGAWSETWSFTTVRPTPVQVTLVSPSDEATDVSIRPTLSWQYAANSTGFDLQVSTSLAFAGDGVYVYSREDINAPAKGAGMDDEHTILEHVVEEDLNNNTTYYWRVRGDNPDLAGEWSETRSFTTIWPVPDMVTELLTPEDGATLVSIRPTFSWTNIVFAEEYELRVWDNELMSGNPAYTASGIIAANKSAGAEISNGVTVVHTAILDLANNTQYFWQVRAKNINDYGPWSALSEFTTIWATPTTVTLVSPDNGSTDIAVRPTLNWQPSNNSTRYDLQVSNSPEFEGVGVFVYEREDLNAPDKGVGVEAVPTLGHVMEQDLANNTVYYWRVRGDNPDLAGEWSETWSFTTLQDLPEPVSLLYPNNTETGIALRPEFKWEASERSVSYELEVSRNQDYLDPVISRNTGANLTFTPAEDLDGLTTYWFRVRGVSENDVKGPWSAPRSFITQTDRPGMVMLSSPNDEATGVALKPEFSWQAASRAATYNIQVSTDPGFDGDETIKVVGLESISLAWATKLTGSMKYYWRVQGVNQKGEGPWSAIRSFTTDLDVPGKVSLRYPNNNTEDVELKPEFTWARLEGADSYQLQVSRNQNFNNTDIDNEEIDQPDVPATIVRVEFLVGNLRAETTYWYRVRAKNTKDYGEWSDARTFKTKEAEVASRVRNIQVRQITTKQVVSKTHSVQSTAAFEISWTPPAFDGGTEIVDYSILFRKSDETTWTTYERPASTDTVAIVTGFESGVAYAFDVLAVNAVGAPEPTDDPPVVVSIETEEIPDQVTLMQNYPNPFNPATTIRFSLPVSSEVSLEVYSMLGQRLAVLVQGQQPAGWHTVSLNATSWASGTYIYRLQADGFTQTKKFLLVK